MSLKIRLARGGAHKRPFYRVVVADVRSSRDGKFIEKLGHFDPLAADGHPEKFVVKQERVTYWLGVGAQPSDRVMRLLAQLGLLAKPTPRPQTKKSQPKAKAQERMKAEQEAAEKAAIAESEAEGMVSHKAEVEATLEAETPTVVEVVEEVEVAEVEPAPAEEKSDETSSKEESDDEKKSDDENPA